MIYTVTLNPAVDREYVVPNLIANTVLRASEVHIDYGGKGFNVSRMLTTLGVRNTALGFIGSNAGAFLEKGMASLGIATDFVHIAHETRTNTTIVETGGVDHYKVNESGPIISAAECDLLLEKVESRVKTDDFWVLAGSLPPGIPADFYRTLIMIIQSAGGKAILDSSGDALMAGVQAKPYLIKPNVFEANSLTGITGKSRANLLAMLENIHGNGVALVVISAGRDVSLFSDSNKVLYGYPPQIEEANPVGAGDAMLAGVLFGLVNGMDMAESFAWGIAAGSAAASKTGTSMPAMQEVQLLKEKVLIEEIQDAV
jgi:1-phosphofructokinase family hexose kinase